MRLTLLKRALMKLISLCGFIGDGGGMLSDGRPLVGLPDFGPFSSWSVLSGNECYGIL